MATRPRMRPVFEIPLEPGTGDVLRALEGLLANREGGVVGQVLPRHAVLQLPPERRSLLSPYLNLEVADAGAHPVLKGRFSPHPNVWTGFMAIYGVLGMLGLLAAMFGTSQWWIGARPWALAGVPAACAAIAFVYGAAVIGQGLTADEMYELRALVDQALRAEPSTAVARGAFTQARRRESRRAGGGDRHGSPPGPA